MILRVIFSASFKLVVDSFWSAFISAGFALIVTSSCLELGLDKDEVGKLGAFVTVLSLLSEKITYKKYPLRANTKNINRDRRIYFLFIIDYVVI